MLRLGTVLENYLEDRNTQDPQHIKKLHSIQSQKNVQSANHIRNKVSKIYKTNKAYNASKTQSKQE